MTTPAHSSSPSSVGRWLLAFLALPVIAFLVTGLFDYFYIRYLVGQFERGLAAVDFANPHLGKALVSAAGALTSFLYIRHSSASPKPLQRIIAFLTTGSFAIASLIHFVSGVTTWGHYFDDLGKAILRYEITYDNRVVFYSNHTVSPATGKPLAEVTPSLVHELETRRRLGKFSEVFSPPPEHWFGSGTGEPLLWYSERDDGIHVFNMSGYDPATTTKLEPVTIDVQRRYYEQKRAADERAAKKAAEAAEQQRQEHAARERAERESEATKLATENARLQKELEIERLIATAVKPIIVSEPQPAVAIVQRSTPPPKPEKPRSSWHINLLPAINVYWNGQQLGGSRPQAAPLHQRCGTNHLPSDVCPATGMRYTN